MGFFFRTQQVQLNLSIRALLYNTSQAYYKCGFSDEVCNVRVLFPKGNIVVLTSPASQQVYNFLIVTLVIGFF